MTLREQHFFLQEAAIKSKIDFSDFENQIVNKVINKIDSLNLRRQFSLDRDCYEMHVRDNEVLFVYIVSYYREETDSFTLSFSQIEQIDSLTEEDFENDIEKQKRAALHEEEKSCNN